MLEKILDIDFNAIGKKNPLGISKNEAISSDVYISLFESYITHYLKSILSEFYESTMTGSGKSSTIIKGKDFQVLLTDEKGSEKIVMEYNNYSKKIVTSIETLSYIFTMLGNSHYSNIESIPKETKTKYKFISKTSKLDILADKDAFYSIFEKDKKKQIYKVNILTQRARL